MESKFYIGQKVVAVYNHSQLSFKKGDVFEILDIRKSCCNFAVRINNKPPTIMCCSDCGKEHYLSNPYYAECMFAPVQEMGDMTFEEAIELVTEKQLV